MPDVPYLDGPRGLESRVLGVEFRVYMRVWGSGFI